MQTMNQGERAFNLCVRCGTCRTVCPVFEETGWESANTRGRMMIIKELCSGRLEANQGVKDSLNTCTTCGLCTENCPAGISPPDIIERARGMLVALGLTTSELEDLDRKILNSGNTFGEKTDRLSWLPDRSLIREKADYVYFVGCMNSYRYHETAKNAFSILGQFGATLLPDEQCCGSPLLRTGFDARRVLEENSRQIERIGARTVITGCAGCYTTLKNSYGNQFQVLSVPEFLASHISEIDLKPLDITVTYHDPCHLGRHNRIYEQPRQVIRAICRLVEMKASRNAARCCGGGGGVRAGYKDLSLQMARRRLEDVPDDVDYIVTSCPLCIRNLRDGGGGEKVIDLVDLVGMAME